MSAYEHEPEPDEGSIWSPAAPAVEPSFTDAWSGESADGKLSGEHHTSSRVADPDLGGVVVDSEENAVGLSYDHGKVVVKSANHEQTEVDGHVFSNDRAMSVGSDRSFDVASKKSHSLKDEHGSESQESDWAAGYADGKATGTIGKKTEEKVGDESHTRSDSRAILDGKKVSVEQKTSSRTKDADLGGKVVESKDRTVGATYDKGKVAVKSAHHEQTEVDGHVFSNDRTMSVGSDRSFDVASKRGHSHKDEQGSESQESDWAAGYADGKATGTIGKKTEEKVGDESHTTRESRATLDGGKLGAEHRSSSRTKDPALGGKVVESRDRSTGASYEGGKVSLARTNKDTTEVDGQTFSKERGTTISSDGTLKTSSKRTHTVKDEDGEHTDARGTTFSAGKDGAAVAYSREKKSPGGGSSSSSLRAGIDAKKGTATVGGDVGLTTKGGTQAKAGGGMTFDRHGNLTSADASASIERGGWTASVKGEYKVEASKPRREGDRFVVEWSRSLTGGAGLGKKGGKLALSGKLEKGTRDFGTRMFKSEAEAENFRKNAASMIGGAFGSQTTVEGALALGIGEARGTGDTSKLGGDLTAHIGVAELGAGGEKSSEDSVLVERLSPTIFQVTVAAKSDREGHVGLGVAGVGATEYAGGGAAESTIVQLDLSTPEGRAAFDEYLRTKTVPKKGAQLVSHTDAQHGRHGTRLSYGPAGSAQFGANQWESVTVGKEGKRELFGGESSQTFTSSVPFFKGHDASSLNVVATLVNDKDRFYSMQGNVDSTDGDYSQKMLARITGTHTDGEKHQSSGKWRVDVNIDDAVVDRFLDRMASQKVRDVGIAEKLARPDFKNELRKLIQAAKTPEDKMRALSYFIAESGLDSHEGIDTMRAEVFGLTGGQWNLDSRVAGTFHSDLYLDKDPHKVFNGIEGRLAVEAKIAQYSELLKASDQGGAALVGSMQADIAELERKRNIVARPTNYTDLPPELRKMQVDTFQRQIDAIRQLRNLAAKDGVKDLGHEEGAHDTADPRMRELRALRRKVAELDDRIAARKQHIAALLPDVKRIPHDAGPEELHAAYLGVKQGDTKQRAALADEPFVDEMRASFVTALDDPESALALGKGCLAKLAEIDAGLEAAERGYQSMVDLNLGIHADATEPPVEAVPAARRKAVALSKVDDWDEASDYVLNAYHACVDRGAKAGDDQRPLWDRAAQSYEATYRALAGLRKLPGAQGLTIVKQQVAAANQQADRAAAAGRGGR